MSSTIITSLFWVKKGWASPIPKGYIKLDKNSEKTNKNLSKISLVSQKLRKEGKLTGKETMKESAKIIKDNINMAVEDNGMNVPVFTEDLKNYYLSQNSPEAPQEIEMEVENENEKDDENVINDASKSNQNNIENLPEAFDEISEEEEEDFTIKPTDSLIVCGTAQDDFSNLEVYVFNEEDLSLYTHHDIFIPSFPLSLEWIPFKNNQKCNYALVGSFTPGIEIWNLDEMDVVEPELILGASEDYTENKGKGNGDVDYYHTDAVMSINLNSSNPNFVLSSGADCKALIWDLNASGKLAKLSFKEHTDKIQSCKWNKNEENLFVTGSFDKTIKIFDTREKKSVFTYKIHSDIECIDWNKLDSYQMLFSFEDGRVQLFDLKNFGALADFKAHKKEATSVCFSNRFKSLFSSVGRDGRVKIWDSGVIKGNDSGENEATLVLEKLIKKSIGELFTCKFSEDCENTIAVGGSKGELYIWQLEESPIFCSKYGLKYEDNIEEPEHLKNISKKKAAEISKKSKIK